MSELRFFASAPKGVPPVLAEELRALGVAKVSELAAGVAFSGSLETGYRACLWSRTASRILLELAEFAVPDEAALYAGVQQIAWDTHVRPAGSLLIDANCRRSQIVHSQFAAQRVKDAIVDQIRSLHGTRPSVARENPDLRLNLFIDRNRATLYVDISGDSLHRRGYREDGSLAPLKQNLAAAILLRATWPDIARSGGALVDPMCGSGTFLIEGAWIAMDHAPGLLRENWGFLHWLRHDPGLWQRLREDAVQRAAAGAQQWSAMAASINGYDADPRVVRIARTNVAAAGLADVIAINAAAVDSLPAAGHATGLVITNPPYGERLGGETELTALYAALGTALKARYRGWHAAVLTGNPPLGKALGLRARRTSMFYNGAIECRLLRFLLTEANDAPEPGAGAGRELGPGAQMFANRLTKNLHNLRRWAAQAGIDCYRVYDADMPEYSAAIDLYQSEKLYAVIQEYEAPKTIDTNMARQRLRDMLNALPPTLDIDRSQVILKRRARQRGAAQYEKQGEYGRFHIVREGAGRFQVNFTDYLDSGLFLDHRITRQRIAQAAPGRELLNLFCYTATATVLAALAGARGSLSIDMSATYLDWAKRNFALNGIGATHCLEQADCLQWLARAAELPAPHRYGVIFLDPPTFSNSKRMQADFDVQRDHAGLIRQCLRLLEPGGALFFSCNLRSFRLDTAALPDVMVEDISALTLPRDFARNPRIHQCFQLAPRANTTIGQNSPNS